RKREKGREAPTTGRALLYGSSACHANALMPPRVLVCCTRSQRKPDLGESAVRIVSGGTNQGPSMKRCQWVGALLAATLLAATAWVQGATVVSVTEHGARGDGKTLDTSALNRAVEACAGAGGGQVRVPPGRYLTGTVRLRTGITLVLDAGAVLVGTPGLDQYESYAPPESRPGDRNHWHRALVLGVGVENVTITGPGVIDGNKVPDPQGEEHMRGPHAVLFGDSRNVVLRDVRIHDAANYAVLLERTSHVEVRGVECTGGWDGVHFRGRKDQPCRDVRIIDCEFSTGDDCLFYGPGRHEHRTSREKHRTNMLAGLCLQPGAWMATEGVLDDVKLSDVVMHDVTTPLHLSVKP